MENKAQISKWLNNELNARELAAFKKTPDYHNYKAIVETAAGFQKPSFDEEQGLKALKEKMASKNNTPVRKLNFTSYYKVAAILVVLIASGLFIWLSAPKTISTGYSEMANLELPDKSKVQLNADSRVKYKPAKWETQRMLHLDGEAFFEVEKGEKFTVETEQGTISVLGTKFNVKNRPGYFEVQCYEGAVQVSLDKKEVTLEKGKSVKIIEGKFVGVFEFDHSQPGWTFEETNFKAVPLNQVIAELERQFDINIEARNIDLDQLFTGSFSHTNMEIALKAVSIPIQLKYKIETENKVILYEE